MQQSVAPPPTTAAAAAKGKEQGKERRGLGELDVRKLKLAVRASGKRVTDTWREADGDSSGQMTAAEFARWG